MSPRLAGHLPQPFVEVHPADAEAAGLTDGGFARVATAHGACVLRVAISDGQQRGSLFAPIHWSAANAASARVGALVAPHTDPFSGQPEAKATPASVAPVVFAHEGFALARTPVTLGAADWFVRVAVEAGHGLLLASNEPLRAWRSRAAAWFGPQAEIAEYLDAPHGAYRLAAFLDGRLLGCLFLGPAAAAPGWHAVKALFEAETFDLTARRGFLSGVSSGGVADAGPLVCACFGVGLATIREALASGRATSVEDIGKALRAGTNCGSCLPELKRIAANERAAHAV